MVKIETWNGFKIRFIWHREDWWAIAADVAKALGYRTTGDMTRIIDPNDQENINPQMLDTAGLRILCIGKNVKIMKLITEFGIYEAILSSNKPEVKEFKSWIKQTLRALRQAIGLEGFQIFRMLDKEHQREAMDKLKKGLVCAATIDYIKANVIADKAISNIFGFPRMIKKAEMTPEMLLQRQAILEDTVTLMTAKERFGLDLSVSRKIYEKYH